MDISVLILLFLLFIFFLLILLFYLGSFKEFIPPPINPDSQSMLYNLPNPWSWDPPASEVCYDEITGKKIECRSYIPVDGIDGGCNVYTFVSKSQYQPANFTFNDINSCSQKCSDSKTCSCMIPYSKVCVDPDQLFAQKIKQICYSTADYITINNNNDTCMTVFGSTAEIGDMQEYFTTCNQIYSGKSNEQKIDNNSINMNNGYCFGSLAILVFNLGSGVGVEIFDNALCIESTNWSVVNNTVYIDLYPIKLEKCNLTKSYNSIPSQLFRFARAEFKENSFKQSNSGSFVSITQRPSEYCLYPSLDPITKNPVLNSVLGFIPKNSNIEYCWFLLPRLPPREIKTVTGAYNLYSAREQIIYVNSPKLIPQTTNTTELWNYIIDTLATTSIYSIQPECILNSTNTQYILKNSGNLIISNMLFYNENEPYTSLTNSKSIICSTQYLDYTLLPLITSNPASYTFYSPI